MINYEEENRMKESVSALEKYINMNDSCRERHEAFIITSTNGKDQHGVRYVFMEIRKDFAVIIIDDLHSLCGHQTNRFTSEDDDFYFVGNRTLQIKPKTSLCGKLVIEITPKN